MYETVKSSPRTQPADRTLIGGILLCAVLFAVVAAMVIWSCWYQLRFQQFVSDLSDSTVYAYQNGGLQMEAAGKQVQIEGDLVYEVYQAVAFDGAGRLAERPERAPDAVLTYGDGSLLELWDMELEGYQSDTAEGVLLRYVDQSGVSYCYDTDGLRLDVLISQMSS